jgi:hypothetical protein
MVISKLVQWKPDFQNHVGSSRSAHRVPPLGYFTPGLASEWVYTPRSKLSTRRRAEFLLSRHNNFPLTYKSRQRHYSSVYSDVKLSDITCIIAAVVLIDYCSYYLDYGL